MDLANGWDTVFGLPVKDVNRIISARKFALGSFNQETGGPTGSFKIEGSLGPFQIVASAGDTITGGTSLAVSVPISSGTFTGNPKGRPQIKTDLSGKFLLLELKLGQTQVNGQTVLSPDPDNITLLSVTEIPDATVAAAVQGLSTAWFKAHRTSFAIIFAQIAITNGPDSSLLGWLKPTTVAYAVNVPPSGFDQAVFAILSMTEQRSAATLQATVASEVIPAGAGCGFVINQRLLLDKMIRPALPALFDTGTGPGDFSIDNDNTRISNNRDLLTALMDLNGSKKATVPDDKFSITIVDDKLKLDFTDFQFSWKEGIELFVHYRETSQLKLTGQRISFQRLDSKTSTVAQSTTTLGLVETLGGIAAGVLALAAGGLASKFVGEVEEGTADAVVSQAENDAGGFNSTLGDVATTVDPAANPADVALVDQEQAQTSADEVTAAVEGNDTVADQSGWFARNKVKIGSALAAFGTIGTIGELLIVGVPEILKKVAEGQAEDLEAFGKFATAAMQPVQWPFVQKIDLTSVTLNGALQLGGNVTFNFQAADVEVSVAAV